VPGAPERGEVNYYHECARSGSGPSSAQRAESRSKIRAVRSEQSENDTCTCHAVMHVSWKSVDLLSDFAL
jgi:hypothetical protein